MVRDLRHLPAVQGSGLTLPVIEIPADLHPDCVPLAWLLGRWEGAGVGDYPTIEAFRFGQEVAFTYVPGKAYVAYTSRSWILAHDRTLLPPAPPETGFWRPQPDAEVEPTKVELATRGVLKTETAKDYRAGHRLYGLVDGRLMWVYEMAAMGHELQPHLSAELQRVAGADQSRS